MANQARYEELLKKRREVGLSDREANELGRIMAEMEGSPYANAQSLKRSEGELEEEPPTAAEETATSSDEQSGTSPDEEETGG